jgi:hypothetical protein
MHKVNDVINKIAQVNDQLTMLRQAISGMEKLELDQYGLHGVYLMVNNLSLELDEAVDLLQEIKAGKSE